MHFLNFEHFCVVSFYQTETLSFEVGVKRNVVVTHICEPFVPVLLFLLAHAGVSELTGTFCELSESLFSDRERQFIQNVVVHLVESL